MENVIFVKANIKDNHIVSNMNLVENLSKMIGNYGFNIEECFLSDREGSTIREAYADYLIRWAYAHKDDGEDTSPVSYEEFEGTVKMLSC